MVDTPVKEAEREVHKMHKSERASCRCMTVLFKGICEKQKSQIQRVGKKMGQTQKKRKNYIILSFQTIYVRVLFLLLPLS